MSAVRRLASLGVVLAVAFICGGIQGADVATGQTVALPAGTVLLKKVKGEIIETMLDAATEGVVLDVKKTVARVRISKGDFWVSKDAIIVKAVPTPTPTPTQVAPDVPALVIPPSPAVAAKPTPAPSAAPKPTATPTTKPDKPSSPAAPKPTATPAIPPLKPDADAPAPTAPHPTPTTTPASPSPAATATEKAPAVRSLVFMPLTSSSLDEKELAAVNEATEQELRIAYGPGVVTQQEMMKLVQFGDDSKQFSCEDNMECAMELTRKLNAELLFGGTVGMVGRVYVATVYIVDGSKGVTAARVSEQTAVKAEVPATAAKAARRAVDGLKSTGDRMTVSFQELGKNPKVAVMDFQATGVSSELAKNITDVVSAELKQFSGMQIISRQEISSLLSFEETKQGMGCSDESCFVEIGNALGATHLLSGAVGMVNDVFIVHIKIIDIKRVKVVGRDQEYFKGPADGLLPAARFVVRRVFGAPFTGDGLLKITVNASDAVVSLNGKEIGVYPKIKLPDSLPAGKHHIAVEENSYFPLSQDIYIEPARQTQVDLVMIEKPTPWWKSWWFWTIVGTVAAGGATAGAVLGTMGGGSPDTGSGKVMVTGGSR